MKYKIHKVPYFNIDEIPDRPICNQIEIKFKPSVSMRWEKITCKKCLKLRNPRSAR